MDLLTKIYRRRTLIDYGQNAFQNSERQGLKNESFPRFNPYRWCLLDGYQALIK